MSCAVYPQPTPVNSPEGVNQSKILWRRNSYDNIEIENPHPSVAAQLSYDETKKHVGRSRESIDTVAFGVGK